MSLRVATRGRAGPHGMWANPLAQMGRTPKLLYQKMGLPETRVPRIPMDYDHGHD